MGLVQHCVFGGSGEEGGAKFLVEEVGFPPGAPAETSGPGVEAETGLLSLVGRGLEERKKKRNTIKCKLISKLNPKMFLKGLE